MLITVYFILVVIVILLLIVFNVRASKKRNAAPEAEADAEIEAADRSEPDHQEGTARVEEPAPVAEAEPVRGAAVEFSATNRSESPPPASKEPGPSRTEPADRPKEVSRGGSMGSDAPVRRDPSGKDVNFRGALRDLSTGSNSQTEIPPRSIRSGESTITDNDYRKALRNMRKEDKEDRS